MLDHKEYARQMRTNAVIIDGVVQVSQELWELIASIIESSEEVVRCKDCRYARINESHPNKPLICRLTKMCGTTPPEWFCADGERRSDHE